MCRPLSEAVRDSPTKFKEKGERIRRDREANRCHNRSSANFFWISHVGNLTGMKKSVLASLFHVVSSSTNNLHYPHCPTGANSWCKYNVDIANGINYYKPG